MARRKSFADLKRILASFAFTESDARLKFVVNGSFTRLNESMKQVDGLLISGSSLIVPPRARNKEAATRNIKNSFRVDFGAARLPI